MILRELRRTTPRWQAEGRKPRPQCILAHRGITEQLGITLDSCLPIQTRKRHMSTMPSNIEEICKKNSVMIHLWLLAQMRQPRRDLHGDLTPATFRTFLDELLAEDNFSINREINGVISTGPLWSPCLDGVRVSTQNLIPETLLGSALSFTEGSMDDLLHFRTQNEALVSVPQSVHQTRPVPQCIQANSPSFAGISRSYRRQL